MSENVTPVRYSISGSDKEVLRNRGSGLDFCIGPQTENQLKKLIRIWRALHESVNVVHGPEKQYRSLPEWSPTGVGVCMTPLMFGRALVAPRQEYTLLKHALLPHLQYGSVPSLEQLTRDAASW